MSKSFERASLRTLLNYPAPAIVTAECKLNQNESPYDLSNSIKKQITKRIAQIPFNRYYDGTCEPLRNKLAKRYNVKSENILVGCGIDELLYYLVLTIVEKGDKILRPVPSFAMYKICTQLMEGKNVAIALDENFEITQEFIKQSRNAKITFICRPNNPTGNSFEKKNIERIARNTKGIVCIDEAYAEFARDNCLDLLKYKNVIIMRTFSKAYSGAVVRLGYAIASKEIIQCINRVRLPWNVSLISQSIGEVMLDNEKYFKEKRKEIIKERQRLEKEMRKMNGVFVSPSDSNFILFKTLRNSNTIFDELLKKGILVRNLEKFGLPNCLRVNAGTRKENNRFLSALKEIAEIDTVLFDLDGVLVDVSKSYRRTIQKTAEKFLERKVTQKEINKVKAIAGFNNDWDVTYAIVQGINNSKKIMRKSKKYEEIKKEFQRLYLGKFIQNEKSLVNPATFSALQKAGLKLGMVTSRPRAEARYAVQKFVPKYFTEKTIIAQEDCRKEKPDPMPLYLAAKRLSAKNSIYVGDTINDQRAAKAANMPFVSVTQAIPADFYVANVNQIIEVIFNATSK